MTVNARDPRTAAVAQESLVRTRVRTNRMFAVLMVVQCIAAVAGALLISPRTWAGTEYSVHAHVLASVLIGVPLAALPVFLALRFPASPVTQHVVGVAQVVEDDEVMIITNGGKVLRCRVSGISTMGRATQGVRIMHLGADEKLVSVARLAERDVGEGDGGNGPGGLS